jgi:hypothetical protein
MLERSEEKNESVLGRAVLVAAESKVELSCPAAETERKLPAQNCRTTWEIAQLDAPILLLARLRSWEYSSTPNFHHVKGVDHVT